MTNKSQMSRTRTSFVVGLKAHDEASWGRFYAKYRDLIYARAVVTGLTPVEAEEAWLLDDSHQAAGRRAAAIVELLPYERIQDRIAVVAADALPKRPPFDKIEQHAMQLGDAPQ